MTSILHSPQESSEALFVVRALTEENIAQELREMYGDEAFRGTVENALAYKAEAIKHTLSAPDSYEELKKANAEYEQYLANLSPAERESIEAAKAKAMADGGAVPGSIPLVPDKGAVAAEHTLTPDQYAGLPLPPRKEKVRANPVKELWDESVEKDADKHPREFGPNGTAMVIEAARQVALHPKLEGDDILALSFLANHSTDSEGRVSRFILAMSQRHRRTRAALTSLLLRIA